MYIKKCTQKLLLKIKFLKIYYFFDWPCNTLYVKVDKRTIRQFINFFLVAFCLLIRMNKLIDSWILLSYTWIFIHAKYLFLNENIENLLYLLIRLITVLIGKLECSVTDLDKRDPTNIIFRPSVPSRSFLTVFPSSRACPFIMLAGATKINYIS